MFTPTKAPVILAALGSAALLAGCVSQSDYDAVKAQNAQLQQQVGQQQQEISSLQAQVTRLQGAIKYTVNSDLLFAPGSWTISKRGEDVMAKIAEKLAPTQTNKLVVNGYTDNAPVGPALVAQGVTSNEILSQKRAEAVMQFLISKGVKPELLSAKGWGDASPVASNSTPKGRSQNRRVEITVAGPAA
jgi:chemotaxis protein MotB